MLWMPNFVALGMYFLFCSIFSWNEGIDIYFDVEYVLLDRNFDFLGGYLVDTARYRSLLLVPTFSMNPFTWHVLFLTFDLLLINFNRHLLFGLLFLITSKKYFMWNKLQKKPVMKSKQTFSLVSDIDVEKSNFFMSS